MFTKKKSERRREERGRDFRVQRLFLQAPLAFDVKEREREKCVGFREPFSMATAGRLTLRALTRSLNNSQVQLQNVATTTQKRSVGNLPVKANSYIENWAHKRENVELTFK